MSPIHQLFTDRFNAAFEKYEAEGTELSDFEAEGLQVSIAADMVEEGLITDINEALPY